MTPSTVERSEADQDRAGGVQKGVNIVDPHDLARDSKGRWLPGQTPATALSLTHDKAVAMGRKGAERRAELTAAKTRKETLAIVQEHVGEMRTVSGPSEAVAIMAGEFVRSALANAMDKPRDAATAAKLALRLADMLPQENRATAVAAVQVVVSQPPAALDAEWRDLDGD